MYLRNYFQREPKKTTEAFSTSSLLVFLAIQIGPVPPLSVDADIRLVLRCAPAASGPVHELDSQKDAVVCTPSGVRPPARSNGLQHDERSYRFNTNQGMQIQTVLLFELLKAARLPCHAGLVLVN